jgi:hypothetical protein
MPCLIERYQSRFVLWAWSLEVLEVDSGRDGGAISSEEQVELIVGDLRLFERVWCCIFAECLPGVLEEVWFELFVFVDADDGGGGFAVFGDDDGFAVFGAFEHFGEFGFGVLNLDVGHGVSVRGSSIVF